MTLPSRPLLTVFFDGLKPESLEHMPFLNSLPHQRRLRTVLGYSIACHASMYTGVYPDRHGLWFLWQRSPETSPFAWLRRAGLLNRLDSLPVRLAIHKLTRRRSRYTSYWGLPRIVNLPLRYWPQVDVSETRYWDEDDYLPGYPTVFERLRRAGVPYSVLGLERAGAALVGPASVEHSQLQEILPWTYLFLGEPDSLSHRHTQGGAETIAVLRRLDQVVEQRYREFQRRVGDFDIFVFSDHGHIPIERKLNPYEVFRRAGLDLNRYLHLIDAGYLRLWFQSGRERAQAEAALMTIEGGYVLDEAAMRRERVGDGSGRYGELVFYLDAGSAFSWTTFGYGLKQRSMHGYMPSHQGCDGVFLSNQPVSVEGQVRLVDILPTILDRLGLPTEAGLDGQAVLG